MGELAVGSIWREHDNRSERYVQIISIAEDDGRVGLRTVSVDAGHWITNRTTYAKASAFGRRYRFVRERA